MNKKGKENLYKTLGTTANIGNARIKEKYIQALRKHPPEIDPEGFEKVRHAYETLKDPEKRRQYDLVRKYGSDVDELVEDAQFAIRFEDYKKAKKLLEKASLISPENPSIMMGMMMVAAAENDFDKVEEYFEHVINTIPESEKPSLYSMKTAMLVEHEYYAEALDALDKWKAIYTDPEEGRLIESMTATVYMLLGREEEAWKSINTAILAIKHEEFDDIHLLLTWSGLMMKLEKWEAKGKVQSRFRKFIKNLTDESEKDMAYDMLDDRTNEALEDAEFQEASFYIDLQIIVDNMDSGLKKKQGEIKNIARVQKDIERLQRDEDAFPLLFVDAMVWFYDGIVSPEELADIKDIVPAEFLFELKQEKEAYAAGILRLRKKYSQLYKHFKEKWDHLFDTLTEGFNREMKRELRRMK